MDERAKQIMQGIDPQYQSMIPISAAEHRDVWTAIAYLVGQYHKRVLKTDEVHNPWVASLQFEHMVRCLDAAKDASMKYLLACLAVDAAETPAPTQQALDTLLSLLHPV